MGDYGGGADSPGVVAPPPLIFAGGLAAGLLLNKLRPTPFLPGGVSRTIGWPLIAGGVLLGLSGFREMRRAGTNVETRGSPRPRSSPGDPTVSPATPSTSAWP